MLRFLPSKCIAASSWLNCEPNDELSGIRGHPGVRFALTDGAPGLETVFQCTIGTQDLFVLLTVRGKCMFLFNKC